MSTTLTLIRTVAGVRTSATEVVLAFEDDGTIGIKNNASGASALAATAAITPTSGGLYEYEVSLSAGRLHRELEGHDRVGCSVLRERLHR